MQKYIIGNWKCNKTAAEAEEWVLQLAESGVVSGATNLQIVLCAPQLYLPLLKGKVDQLSLGAQTVSAYTNGSYTGAVSAQQLAQFVQFALLGHVERRKYFHEDNQTVAQQVRQALDAKITPIIAVDDQNWVSQLTLLEPAELHASIVMYEPPGAISTSQGGGRAAELDDVAKAITRIRTELSPRAVLYGGSVNAANVAEYIGHPAIDGVVPGAASLDVQEFRSLIWNASASL